jgi:hypothetical protein
LTVLPPMLRLLPEIAKLPLFVAPEHDPVVARAKVDPTQLPTEQVAVIVSIVVPVVAGVVKLLPFESVTPDIVGDTVAEIGIWIRLASALVAIATRTSASSHRIIGKTP